MFKMLWFDGFVHGWWARAKCLDNVQEYEAKYSRTSKSAGSYTIFHCGTAADRSSIRHARCIPKKHELVLLTMFYPWAPYD